MSTCMSGHTFRCVSHDCVRESEQTCVHTVSEQCVCVCLWACEGPVHSSPCLEGTHPATSTRKQDSHQARLGVRSWVAMPAPQLERLLPLLSLDSLCHAGCGTIPLQHCAAGGGGEMEPHSCPARSWQRSGGQRLLPWGGNCRAGPTGRGPLHENHNRESQDTSFTPTQWTWALTLQRTGHWTRGRRLLGGPGQMASLRPAPGL